MYGICTYLALNYVTLFILIYVLSIIRYVEYLFMTILLVFRSSISVGNFKYILGTYYIKILFLAYVPASHPRRRPTTTAPARGIDIGFLLFIFVMSANIRPLYAYSQHTRRVV